MPLYFDRPTLGGNIMLLVKENHHIVADKCFTFGNIQVLYIDVECAQCALSVLLML